MTNRVRKPRANLEFQHQVALMQWARLPCNITKYPGLQLLSASLNGVKMTPAQAGKAKAAGMLKGEHDLKLPVARGRWIGLSIEMKAGSNRPTADQLDYGSALEAEGWKVVYAWSWTEARDAIVDYLQQPRPVLSCP
jgi:hypothetical protein